MVVAKELQSALRRRVNLAFVVVEKQAFRFAMLSIGLQIWL